MNYYPEDVETFDGETETGITESQEAIDDFINQQKSANTNKKTATDMNTLLRYMEANGMKNEKIESLPASELDHLLSKFFLNARKRKQNGDEYEPATVSGFQRSIQRYVSEKKYPFNILKDNEFQKSRKVLAAKRKSLVHEHGKGNKPQAAQAIDEDEEDAFFEAGEFGDSNPVALQSNSVLFKLILDDFTFNKFVFRTCGSLLLSELLASLRIRQEENCVAQSLLDK